MPHVGGRRGMKQRRGQRRRTPFKQSGVTARRKGGKVRRRRAAGGRAMSGINGNTPQRKRSHRRRRVIRKPTRGRNLKVGRPGMGPVSARRNYQVGGLTGGHWCYYGTRTPWTGKVLTHNGVSYGVGSDGVMAGDSPRLGSCDGNT